MPARGGRGGIGCDRDLSDNLFRSLRISDQQKSLETPNNGSRMFYTWWRTNDHDKLDQNMMSCWDCTTDLSIQMGENRRCCERLATANVVNALTCPRCLFHNPRHFQPCGTKRLICSPHGKRARKYRWRISQRHPDGSVGQGVHPS